MTDKINLTSAGSGYNLTVINDNFTKIETALNDRVLYRDVQAGEVNSLLSDLDANGKRIYNLPAPIDLHEAARLQDVQDAVSGATSANLISADDGAGGTIFTTVQSFITKILSSTGSSIVGFLQAGTGAIMRSVQDKLREHIDVKDFGATGDGVTDDTTQIQAALTAGECSFSPGSYRTSAKLTTSYSVTGKSHSRTSIVPLSNAVDILELNDTTGEFLKVQDIRLANITRGTGSGLVMAGNNNNVEVNRVAVSAANIGIDAKYVAWMQRYRQIRCDNCSVGFHANGRDSGGAGAGTTLIYDQCYATNGTVVGWNLEFIRTVEMLQPATDMGGGMTNAIVALGVGHLHIVGHHFEGTPPADGAYITYTTNGSLSHGITITGGAIENANLSARNYRYLDINANDDTVHVILNNVNVRNLTGGASAKLAKLTGSAGSHIEIIAIDCDFGAIENIFDVTGLSGTYSYRRIDQEFAIIAAGKTSVAGGGVISTGVAGGLDSKRVMVQHRRDDGVLPTVMAHVTQTYSGNGDIQIRFSKLSDGTADAGTYDVEWWVAQ